MVRSRGSKKPGERLPLAWLVLFLIKRLNERLKFGLELALTACGARLVRTDVGDPAVVREMLANSYNLGGEQSGQRTCGYLYR